MDDTAGVQPVAWKLLSAVAMRLPLTELLDCTPRELLDELWDAQPRFVRGARDRFGGLLSTSALDELIAANALEPDALTVLLDGKRVPRDVYRAAAPIARNRSVHDAVDPAELRALYAGGASLLIHGLERKLPALRELAAALRTELGMATAVNAILSPPGAAARTLGLHYDVCGVLVLQVEGCKRWRVHAPSFALPLPHHAFTDHGDGAPGEPVGQWTLQPGDALFVPRGHRHVAEPTWEHSLHVAIQLAPCTVYDLARDALLGALDELAVRDVALRRAVDGTAPPSDAVRGAVAAAIAQCAADAAAPPLSLAPPSAPAAPRLADVHAPRYRASGAPFEYERTDGDGYARLEVSAAGATLELPAEAEPLLARLRRSPEPFEPGALRLDLPARLQRRVLDALAARGLVHRCSHGA